LPVTVVSGADIPLTAATTALDALSDYLGVPMFRFAVVPGFEEFTKGWEHHALGDHVRGVEPEAFVQRFLEWIKSLPQPPKRRPARAGQRVAVADTPHFCSHMVNKVPVDSILARFDSFCIAGQDSSVPYVSSEIERLGKRYVRLPSHAAEALEQLEERYDCLILCGTWGETDTEMPVVALQHASQTWRTLNLGEFGESLPYLNDRPVSGADWFLTFEIVPDLHYKIWSAARVAMLRDYDLSAVS
jgi:hypothetical protein